MNQPSQINLFDTDGTIFMGSRRDPSGCRVGLFGVPYDGTTSFRPGTRFGPAAIREVSQGLETYCPQLDLDLKIWSMPISVPWTFPWRAGTRRERCSTSDATVLDQGMRPLILGGEHSISSGAVAAVARRIPISSWCSSCMLTCVTAG